MDKITKKDIPRPILKWVGGKGQIIDKLLKAIPKEMNDYHELFVGGGSFLVMVLWAKNKGYITINGSLNAYDLNEALISTYINIRDNKDELFEKVKELQKEFLECDAEGIVNRKPNNKQEAITSRESYYYWIRKEYNGREHKDR